MSSTRNPGRVAGFLYLLLAIPAPFGLMYVPGKLFVRGNATATAENILASQTLFRLGIVSELVASTIFIFLGLALYRLLEGVNRRQASLMAILVLAQVPMSFLNVVNEVAALMLVRGADFLSVFDKPQRDALALLFVNLHGQGIVVTQIFWGLWLFPFGVLVFRSGFIPRILGVWLIINGLAYVTMSLTGLLAPQHYGAAFKIAFPVLFGEMAMMLWLLIKGAEPKASAAPASPAAGG